MNMWRRADEMPEEKELFKEYYPKEYEALVEYFSVPNPILNIQRI